MLRKATAYLEEVFGIWENEVAVKIPAKCPVFRTNHFQLNNACMRIQRMI